MAILKFKMDDKPTNTDLIADNIFRILSIKNVGKATNTLKHLSNHF